MKTAGQVDELWTWSEHQMIGIGQNDLRSESLDFGGMERLYRGLRANRHEGWSLDDSGASANRTLSGARSSIAREQLERKVASGITGSDRLK
jgi:hypothetical protein